MEFSCFLIASRKGLLIRRKTVFILLEGSSFDNCCLVKLFTGRYWTLFQANRRFQGMILTFCKRQPKVLDSVFLWISSTACITKAVIEDSYSCSGLLKFRAVVEPRNPAKLTKTREIPRNSLEIQPKTCRDNIFETYLGYWSCLLAVNLQIYLEFSSLPRVNNVPKLPGVNVAKNWAREMRRLFVDTIQSTKGNCCLW